jgi:[acyl-carrier-protein] S-malonyltransferase
VVARVAGHEISTADLEGRLAEMRHGPRARHIPHDGAAGSETVRRWVVQELVTEGVIAHEMREAGVADVAILVASVTAGVTVPEADAVAYYERNQDLYRRVEAGRGFVVPFADVRAAIEADLLAAARSRIFDEWLERRRAALAVIEPGFEHPGHPIHGVPSHRH